MSRFQPVGTSINQFVPNYVVKSDYLPTHVHEGSNQRTSEAVHIYLIPSCIYMKNKREEGSSILKDPQISYLADMHPIEFMKMFE